MSIAASLGSRSSLPRPVVLVVERDVGYRQTLSAVLVRAGCEVVEATHVDDALRMIGESRIDAVLLEQTLPGAACAENCRRVRSVTALRELPLLLLATSEDPAYVIPGLDAGADDYVLKSTDVEVLKAKLRVHLRRRGIVMQVPDSAPAKEVVNAAAPPAELDAEALTRLQESVDVEGVLELIDAALADVPKRLAALFAAIEQRNAAAVVVQAHQLKSSTAIFGGTRLAAACADLEAMARAGRLSDIDRAAAGLRDRLERFSVELREERRQRAGR